MIHQLFETLDKKFNIERAKAHCDIPCGIYDPITAQIAALTVVRMIDLMNGLEGEGKDYDNTMSRYIAVKEEHAEQAKHEIRVIWGDFIKTSDLNELTHQIMQLGSKCRQTKDRSTAVELVEAINQFAEKFWATKGVKTKRAKAPYEPGLELVYPDL